MLRMQKEVMAILGAVWLLLRQCWCTESSNIGRPYRRGSPTRSKTGVGCSADLHQDRLQCQHHGNTQNVKQ